MRNVIVTGGSRGLGLATTKALVGAGFRVIAVARSQSEHLTALMDQPGLVDSVKFAPFDFIDIDGIPALVQAIKNDFGPIYGLVNNAAIGTEGLLAMMRNEHIEDLLKINVSAPIVLTKYVVRNMMSEGRGRIINVASIIASTGYNGLSVYGASKAALIGFTKSLAREVGKLGITVNAVAPGFVATDMTSGIGDHDLDRIAKRSALRRLVNQEDVAAAIAFLASDAASNITGTVMTVDAGATA